jgi:hypothetical protein
MLSLGGSLSLRDAASCRQCVRPSVRRDAWTHLAAGPPAPPAQLFIDKKKRQYSPVCILSHVLILFHNTSKPLKVISKWEINYQIAWEHTIQPRAKIPSPSNANRNWRSYYKRTDQGINTSRRWIQLIMGMMMALILMYRQ